MWQYWVEELLFLYIFLGSNLYTTSINSDRKKDVSYVVKTYLDLPNTRPKRLIAVMTLYFQTNSKTSVAPFSGVPKHPMQSKILKRPDLEEMTALLERYEALVTTIMPFPNGEAEPGGIDAERLVRVTYCFDLWTVRYNSVMPGETRGQCIERHYKLIEVCFVEC